MSIVFTVIDTTCESADQSFFPPRVAMQTKSTTEIATVYGYGEFIPSNPPKRYHNITFTGISERIGFTAEPTPRQCAGGKYLFSGTGTIDVNGVQTSKYKKDFFAQCAKQFWPLEPLQINPNSMQTGGLVPRFVGFCWPDEPQSCLVCDPVETNWPFLGNVATNNPQVDLSAFIYSPNVAVTTHTSFSVNDILISQTEIDAGLNFPKENLPTGQAPPNDFVFAAYVKWTDTNNYSAVLSGESTDAEAQANAKMISGTGATTQNSVQTTGLPALVGKVSITTNVVFTLFFTDLIPGNDYVATVDLWEQDPSSSFSQHTTRQYGFTAASPTNTITDVVPTPILGHTITVRNPTVTFSP